MFDELEVRCRAGYKGEETPSSFVLDGTPHEVVEVCDRWYNPDADYFKVKAEDDCLYLLRRDTKSGEWSLRYIRVREPDSPLVKPPEGSWGEPH